MDATEQNGRASAARASQPAMLLTGVTGFVGSFLAAALRDRCRLRAASRQAIGDLGPTTDWREALDGIDVVVHAAGPAHAKYPADEVQRAIVEGSAALAAQAARAGVKRFIYISSIRACVSFTFGRPATEETPPQPDDAYGRAKLEAEQAILAEAALRPIALRPPMVIDANAKGNFASLLRLLDTALPLPFAGINNKRNVISLASLGEAVAAILDADQNPASGVFHVADQPAVSTAEMAALVRSGMCRPPRLFSAPGFAAIAPRPLVRSLEVDDRKFRETFAYRGQDAREALEACGKAWTSA
jgi:nucleoside-diphosphate-sugar epimerase